MTTTGDVRRAGVDPAGPGAPFSISSPAFANGDVIPIRFTCDGEDVSPPLVWGAPPRTTRSFTLIVHDPDAPVGDWVHWLMYDVPAEKRGLPEGVPGRERIAGLGSQGRNDFGRLGWGGPCPPHGRVHRYRFRLLALDRVLDLPPHSEIEALVDAVRGHILAEARMGGTYRRL